VRNLERHTVETGRVIQRRYLLQRLIKRGNACAVYQGFDQVLQRAVAVKVAPAEHIAAYRAAIRATSQFTHPHIVGIYDIVVEPETLYIVQEFVEGDDFATLLQSQLSPYSVAEMGMQICQALLYASTPARKVCHGDLTPASLLRDRRGQVRVSNFALPSDLYYFTAWSTVGGNGFALSDRELPPGQLSDGRRDDDTRAVGLLLYQLLAGRNADAVSVEPPADGRLRFLRNVPPELCDVVARAVVRQHPQHLATPDQLYAELKAVAAKIEPVAPVVPAAYPSDEAARIQQFSPSQPDPSARTTAAEATPLYAATNARMMAVESVSAPTVADVSMKLAAAGQMAYPGSPQTEAPPRSNLLVLLLLCLFLFGIFFGVGYFVAHTLIP